MCLKCASPSTPACARKHPNSRSHVPTSISNPRIARQHKSLEASVGAQSRSQRRAACWGQSLVIELDLLLANIKQCKLNVVNACAHTCSAWRDSLPLNSTGCAREQGREHATLLLERSSISLLTRVAQASVRDPSLCVFEAPDTVKPQRFISNRQRAPAGRSCRQARRTAPSLRHRQAARRPEPASPRRNSWRACH
jgi:hypothetical protein